MATLNEMQAELAQLKEARNRILSGGQSYRIGSRQKENVNLSELAKMIASLEMRVAMAQGGGKINTGHAVFRGRRG